MATRQELIDFKYDDALALHQIHLMELFSPEILTWARNKGATTFQEIQALTATLNLSNKGLTEIKGLQFLPLIKNIVLNNNELTAIDIGSNVDLEVLELDDNNITSIDITNNVDLKQLRLNNNLIESIDVTNNVDLNQLRLFNNALDTSAVDSVLSQCNTLRIGGATFTGGIQLHGAGNGIPTDGASNSDYLALTGAGISVTIRTS